MKTQHYDVEIYYSDKTHARTMRVEARNKGDAIGKARKLNLGYKLSFKAFNVNKGHNQDA